MMHEVMRRKWPARINRAFRILRGDAMMYGILIREGAVYAPTNRRTLIARCRVEHAPTAITAPKL